MSQPIKTYRILAIRSAWGGRSYPTIMCLVCRHTSCNENDISNLYCGFCHRFHDDPAQLKALQDLTTQDTTQDVTTEPGAAR